LKDLFYKYKYSCKFSVLNNYFFLEYLLISKLTKAIVTITVVDAMLTINIGIRISDHINGTNTSNEINAKTTIISRSL
jgi:hypothetical protein